MLVLDTMSRLVNLSDPSHDCSHNPKISPSGVVIIVADGKCADAYPAQLLPGRPRKPVAAGNWMSAIYAKTLTSLYVQGQPSGTLKSPPHLREIALGRTSG